MSRGVFITFEGGEGLGKSTQIKMLAQALRKRTKKVLVTREPGGTPVGEKLRKLLKQNEMHPLTEVFVLEASRAEHVEKVIRPALLKSWIVICDRYCESSLAYQGITRGLGLRLIEQANALATSGLKADRVILLDGKIQRLGKKSKGDRFDQAGKRFHESIRKAFLKIAQGDSRFRTYQADQGRRSLHKEILADLEPLLKLHQE